jgi:hypothetical protein
MQKGQKKQQQQHGRQTNTKKTAIEIPITPPTLKQDFRIRENYPK